MFFYCSDLTEAPELPATQLAKSCYTEMFLECANLKIPPKLPATQLEDFCYAEMFANCPSLEKEAEIMADISSTTALVPTKHMYRRF